MQPKVLHILNDLRLSGAEFMLASAARELGAAGSTILATGETEGEFAEPLRSSGYTVLHLPFSKSPKFFYDFNKLIRSTRYDVIHLHTERARFWYLAIIRMAQYPVITTVHNEFRFTGNLRWRRAIGRRVAERMGVVFVACSERVARNEKNRFGISPLLIPNWCDPRRVIKPSRSAKARCRTELGVQEDTFFSISISNEAPAKNLPTLVETIASLGEGHIHFHLGSVSDELVSTANRLMGERIRFLGSVPEIARYLAASDVFVCSSIFEGAQLVQLEAAAAGVPCVTTEVGVAEEFRGVPGMFFVEPEASSLAAGIRRVRALKEAERFRMGAALSRFALSRYVPSVGAERYADLYRAMSRNDAFKRGKYADFEES